MFENLAIYISTFVFVFTLISVMRIGVNFITALLSSPPRKLEIGQRELIYYGLSISYIITFLIYLI